jgi:ribosomal protein S18 acetylase RimI-like enzyme
MQQNIRKLERSDREQVLEIVRATNNFNEQEVSIAAELVDVVLDQPEQADYYAYVYEAEGNVSGFLLLGPTPATAGTYDMYWIVVDPDYQGQGIAQALDACAVSFVQERNGYWLIAETSSQPSYERSRAFYVKQGYSVLARIPDYYKPGDDLIIFGKRVGEPRNESSVVGAEISQFT